MNTEDAVLYCISGSVSLKFWEEKMRKSIALLMVFVLVIGMFAGCTSDNTDTPTTTSAAGTTNPPSSPSEPTVLTALFDQSDGWIRNFNPFMNGSYQFVNGFMHEHLILFDTLNSNTEHMWLAEDIISEPDNKTLIVKVRPNVKWSDGEEFNAEDVAFSYTYSKDHPTIDRTGD